MEFTEAELEAYIEESLDPVRAAQLEQAMRDDETLVQKLSFINSRRDAGIHTLGEIWRRNQIGVPAGKRIRDYIMGTATDEEADYIRFRLEILKCPFTIACWKDLKEKLDENAGQEIESRRRKYFNSSAGLLRHSDD